MSGVTVFRLYLENDLNRVYTQSMVDVVRAELDVVLDATVGPAKSVTVSTHGRSSVLSVDHDDDISGAVTSMSATAAVFVERAPTALEPVPCDDDLAFGTDVVTTQRYKGKTNERLTRLMVNTARVLDASKAVNARSIIDPMCGRGTTLNWALLYGIPAVGLDIDRRALDEYATFLQQWAQGHRFPHRMQRFKKERSDGRHFEFSVARDRATLEAKQTPDIRVFHAPADAERVPVGKASMVVSDLPYGIQHRGRSAKAATSIAALIEQLSPRWTEWIRIGGSLAMSWT